MPSLTLAELLESGAHFGHQTRRWNPKMKRYILCPRNGIYIIDLNKTIAGLDRFIEHVKAKVSAGGNVLFVGTKKQLKDCIKEEAIRCGMPYVTERWLGGMLTNFSTIRQSVRKLEKIEQMETDGTLEVLPKKEVLSLMKKKDKLLAVLSGIRHLKKAPSVVFVVDSIKEHIALAESQRLRIPIGAIVDTNSDPDGIDFPIPGNDDAIKSVQAITRAIADAIVAIKGEEVKPEEMAKKSGIDSVEDQMNDAAANQDESEDTEEPIKKKRVVRKKMVEAEDK